MNPVLLQLQAHEQSCIVYVFYQQDSQIFGVATNHVLDRLRRTRGLFARLLGARDDGKARLQMSVRYL
jgi:hypothetical protein